jgi:hypothetical protein
MGLFGVCFNGSIQNIGIENCNIVGKTNTGGLLGVYRSDPGYISNCYITGNVNGGYYTGGLVGSQWGSSITNCYAAVKVSGIEEVGGLVGRIISEIKVTNCYAINSIEGDNDIGGLVGRFSNSNSGEIRNCVAANNTVILYTPADGIGRISSNGTLINNYAVTDMVVRNTLGEITITEGLNTKDGKNVPVDSLQSFYFYATAKNWNGGAWDITATPLTNPDAIWNICDEEGLPFLSWQNIDCSVGIDEFTTDNLQFTIYPNPTSGQLRITNYELRDSSVEVFDIYGRKCLVSNSLVSNSPISIDISHLSGGVYILKFISEGKVIGNSKIVKQ